MANLRDGLADARKAGTRAIRKLFGRHPPNENKEASTAVAAHNSENTGENSNEGPSSGSNTSTPAAAASDDDDDRGDRRARLHSDSSQNKLGTALNALGRDSEVPETSYKCDGDELKLQKTCDDPTTAISSTTTPPSPPMLATMMSAQQPYRRGQPHMLASTKKENQPLLSRQQLINMERQPTRTKQDDAVLTDLLNNLDLDKARASPESNPLDKQDDGDPIEYMPLDPALEEERRMHLEFMEEALEMARDALTICETPVGAVFVYDNKIIAKGMNATNVTRNGTRHAEFMALSALFSHPPRDGPRTTSLRPKMPLKVSRGGDDSASVISSILHEGNEDGSKGHLYPYGQKIHPDERVSRSIIKESILYVTVEPCVMCASLLRQLGVKKVYFGAVNDKFGGTGGVFSIHANSLPVSADGPTAAAHPVKPTMRLPDGRMMLGTSYPPGGGDGGNVEDGYEIEGGWGRDEAVGLLRRFYVQENGRAPVPRKKEGRAARLAAILDGDADSINSGSAAGNGTADEFDAKGESGDGETSPSNPTSHAQSEKDDTSLRKEPV